VSHIIWSVRPELFQYGSFALRWYSLFFAILFGVGYLIVRWQFRVEGRSETDLDSLLVHIVVGTIVGARLGHCLLYEPAYYLSHPIEILEVWKGGLASHGGAVGVLLAIFLYHRQHLDQPYWWLLDRVVVPTALAAALIRLGNLFNSEILGHPTDLPWAFVFRQVDLVPRHPVQLYESLSYTIIFLLLLRLYQKQKAATPRGSLLGLFLVTVFSARFLCEFFKERQADYEANLPLSVGQWLSIPFILLGVFLFWRSRGLAGAPRRPK
jgi:prolipoprotein diacylglyceryl transferase